MGQCLTLRAKRRKLRKQGQEPGMQCTGGGRFGSPVPPYTTTPYPPPVLSRIISLSHLLHSFSELIVQLGKL